MPRGQASSGSTRVGAHTVSTEEVSDATVGVVRDSRGARFQEEHPPLLAWEPQPALL